MSIPGRLKPYRRVVPRLDGGLDRKLIGDAIFWALETASRELRASPVWAEAFARVDAIKATPGWEPYATTGSWRGVGTDDERREKRAKRMARPSYRAR